MIKEHDVQVDNISKFGVRGNNISATFDVVIAALEWTEEQAVEFTNTVYDSNPDLFPYALQFEQIAGDEVEIGPTTVERMSFRWIRNLNAPEPREKLKEEFASRRQEVLSLLSRHTN